MADKLIGSLFARARKAKERRYVASARDVGRLMRLFHGTIEALETAQQEQRDGFAVVDEVVGWAKLTRVRGEVRTLADLAEEDPLLGAADRYRTLRKFAPELLAALEFKAARSHDPTLSAIKLLQDLNRSGKRDVPPDAPMPFRKEWKRLVTEDGQPNRRLYESQRRGYGRGVTTARGGEPGGPRRSSPPILNHREFRSFAARQPDFGHRQQGKFRPHSHNMQTEPP